MIIFRSRCSYLINNSSKKFLRSPRYLGCSVSLNKSKPDCVVKKFTDTPEFKAFKEKQAKMQCDDGYPVYLKGGTLDKILYHLTVGGCIIGIVQSVKLIYSLANT